MAERFTTVIDSNNEKSLWDEQRTEEEPLIALNRFGEICGIDECCELLNQLYYELKGSRLREDDLHKYLKEIKDENEQLKQQIRELQSGNDDVEWLRNNTVWEQMPSNRRTFTKTNYGGDVE